MTSLACLSRLLLDVTRCGLLLLLHLPAQSSDQSPAAGYPPDARPHPSPPPARQPTLQDPLLSGPMGAAKMKISKLLIKSF